MCKYDSFVLYVRFLGLGFSLCSVVFREFSHLERSSFYKALLSYWMGGNALCLVRISSL